MQKTLFWGEFEKLACYSLFNVWAGEGQFLWAKQAWNAVVKAGLADYRDEIERHIVIIRLMTLATFYNEFRDLVWDEYFDREIVSEWMQDEEFFHPIRIFQIIGPDFYKDENIAHYFKNDSEFIIGNYLEIYVEALNDLIDRHRDEVFNALISGFGDEVNLFMSLLITGYSRDDGTDYKGIDELTDEEWKKFGITEDGFDLKDNEEDGLYWINIGMPRSPRENI